MGKKRGSGETIIIKKYANRRLYNTDTSTYITLDDLAAMVRQGMDFKVLDARSGDDLTRSILTQIIMEEEGSNKQQLLPISFLRDLIAMYGQSMQAVVPAYLEASMTQFRKHQDTLRETFDKGLVDNPLARIAENNMAMMRAAAGAWIPQTATARKDGKEEQNGSAKPHNREDDLSALKREMAAMQKRLDELGK